MKISLIMNVRMPTEKAHGYQIAKMCEALALRGNQVSLIVPTRKNEILEDIFSYYSVKNNFTVNFIPTFDAISFLKTSRLGFYVQEASFLFALRPEHVSSDSTVITRNAEVAWWYARQGYRVFFDAHNLPGHSLGVLKYLLKNISGIIANSNGTAQGFRNLGFTNILIAPNAVNLEEYVGMEPNNRSYFGLPEGRIAMYVGHLYGWKGVGVVVEAARKTKINDLTFVFLGGTDEDIERYRNETKDLHNILFLGHRPHGEVPKYIKNADVLLLPNIPSTRESIMYTSPIKMFEYMASGVPIVASSLPSIREVLNSTNSILVEPGNPDELMKGIEQALNSGSKDLSLRAKKDVQGYTWDARADKILSFVEARQ